MKRRNLTTSLLSTCATLFFHGCTSNSPSKPVRELYRSFEERDYEKFRTLFSDNTNAAVSRADFQETVLQLQEAEGYQLINVLEERTTGDSAKVKVETATRKGTREYVLYTLRKSDDTWKIHSSEILSNSIIEYETESSP